MPVLGRLPALAGRLRKRICDPLLISARRLLANGNIVECHAIIVIIVVFIISIVIIVNGIVLLWLLLLLLSSLLLLLLVLISISFSFYEALKLIERQCMYIYHLKNNSREFMKEGRKGRGNGEREKGKGA